MLSNQITTTTATMTLKSIITMIVLALLKYKRNNKLYCLCSLLQSSDRL